MTATKDDLLKVAEDAGMTILLNGRIGQQDYTSVSGTTQALQKFADAMRETSSSRGRRVRAAVQAKHESARHGAHAGTHRRGKLQAFAGRVADAGRGYVAASPGAAGEASVGFHECEVQGGMGKGSPSMKAVPQRTANCMADSRLEK